MQKIDAIVFCREFLFSQRHIEKFYFFLKLFTLAFLLFCLPIFTLSVSFEAQGSKNQKNFNVFYFY